jgi:hypothetical protein
LLKERALHRKEGRKKKKKKKKRQREEKRSEAKTRKLTEDKMPRKHAPLQSAKKWRNPTSYCQLVFSMARVLPEVPVFV